MANIISLTVENFRSYKDKFTFTFEAVDADACSGNYHDLELVNGEKRRLLNSAVIYGPNAAGKSNIIWAFHELKYLVENSRELDPKDKLLYEPYSLSTATKGKPTKISIEFIIDGYLYTYAISYTDTAVHSETLIKYNAANRKMPLIDRAKNGIAKLYKSGRPKKVLANHLALSELGLQPIENIQKVYLSLTEGIIVPLLNFIDLTGDNMKVAKEVLSSDDERMKKLLFSLIEMSDTGVCGIALRKKDDDMSPLRKSMFGKKVFITYNSDSDNTDVVARHKDDKGNIVEFPIDVESAGTKTIFGIGSRILKTLSSGGFLAYDEVNIALHPKLFRRIVELFHSKVTNPKNAQLLITTHDTTLLEDHLMRADQIWFVEKKDGVSEAYSAIDFEGVSIDQPFEPWYRAGRLGARPDIKPFQF